MSDLVVYSLHKAPISYIGELVKHTVDEVVLSKVLVLYQQNSKNADSEQVTIGNVPFASRESTLSLSKEACPGVLIEKPDEDLISHYGKEIIAAYSKLRVIA